MWKLKCMHCIGLVMLNLSITSVRFILIGSLILSCCSLEELFYNFKVDLVLQAHEHNYERLYPVFKGVVLSKNYTNPPAPIQIISGAAGSKHGVDHFQQPSKRKSTEWMHAPYLSVLFLTDFYCLIMFLSDT